MKSDYSKRAGKTLRTLSPDVRKALFKQVKFLEQDLNHPSLHAKKYDESGDLWQARVNKDWRFYFHNSERHLLHRGHNCASEVMPIWMSRTHLAGRSREDNSLQQLDLCRRNEYDVIYTAWKLQKRFHESSSMKR